MGRRTELHVDQKEIENETEEGKIVEEVENDEDYSEAEDMIVKEGFLEDNVVNLLHVKNNFLS